MGKRKIRRKTETCSNCGIALDRAENYCHDCGQENSHLNVPMKDLLMEIIGGLTFFEAKFIQTARYIFTHPGKLTLDFNFGKRTTYMHPVRMYFWVSFIFFLVAEFDSGNSAKSSNSKKNEVEDNRNFVEVNNNRSKDYEKGREIGKLIVSKGQKDSVIKKQDLQDTTLIKLGMFNKLKIKKDSIEYYYNLDDNSLDSVLKAKGISTFYSNKRHIRNDIEKQYEKYIEKKYGVIKKDPKSTDFFSLLPTLMFILLPLATLLLWFFERHTHWKFYFQHLVFTLYTHSAIFLMWSIIEIITELVKYLFHFELSGIVKNLYMGIYFTIGYVYFLISLKKVYNQSWTKTVIKFFLLSILYIILMFFIILIGVFSGLIPNF
jgi:hypothetical protein